MLWQEELYNLFNFSLKRWFILGKTLGPVMEERNVDISTLTSMKIGGIADFLVRPPTLEHLIEIVESSRKEGIPVYPIGRASNVVLAERIHGKIVLTTAIDDIDVYIGEGIIAAECGSYLGTLASVARNYSLSGLEYVHEIPGTLGGGIYMNCGFRSHPISEIVKKVYALSPEGGVEEFDASNLEFGHRRSIFQTEDYKDWIILRAELQLKEEDPRKIEKLMQCNHLIRRVKHPFGERSSGCVFINQSPNYIVEGKKYTAHKLIKGAGCAGWREGQIYVYPKYTPFFINKKGEHSIEPFITLLNKVYGQVLKVYGVPLETEVKPIPPTIKLIR